MRHLLPGVLMGSIVVAAGVFVACESNAPTQAGSDGLMPQFYGGAPAPCPGPFEAVDVSQGSGADRNLNGVVCRTELGGRTVEIDDAAAGPHPPHKKA
jgi:hypothetical protein